MADIKSYLKEKEKREQIKSDYKEKIMRHKLQNVYRVLLTAVVVLAVILLIFIQYKRHIYSGYDIVSSVAVEAATGANDMRLQNCILTYSKDGAHCSTSRGVVNWNQTYEIQDIQIAVNQDVVAIASYNGREIYVQNTEKQLGSITTNMPIRDIAVSATGNVTAVLSDADVTWINTYDASGQMLFTGQVHMQEAGYPVDIALSPNGVLLAVSYVYLDAGMLKSNIVFYNFGPVGENMSDHIVSVYSYSDALIPELHFADNETLFAVGDNRLSVFKGNQTPVDSAGHFMDRQIQAVFYGEKYIGLVMGSDDEEHTYQMDIYNTDGKKVRTHYFDLDYTDIFFEEDGFGIYNETECQIVTYGGVEKFNGTFSTPAKLLIPTNGTYRYIMVTESSIDVIQLK
ncbi:MAG: hypothetical protein IJ747_01835 [Lachnospiraceae bacterium]|nr:hypothetical protein [Lachnospiraceae bacterium]